jgi:hypothetical protein
MKKFFIFAASALALLACAKTEELIVNPEETQSDAIKFEVYTQRGLATRAGVAGTNDNTNIGTRGFGVFAYYTAGEKYDNNAKPNFMYNQKVEKPTSDGGWVYEPVKYWPNEYGDAAVSDDVDYVTFFAYAPWTYFEPTTGNVKEEKTKNIISVNKNNGTGDPIIKYVVDTDPATSVDLLWGVAAENADDNYSAIGGNQVSIEEGMPFIDLVKPGKPATDKLSFNLKHSLAKVKFTIDYIADQETPGPLSDTINAAQTRIFVRSFTINGLAMKGALNLHNQTPGHPLWKDFDGVKDLSFDATTFNDGRKDGKEGDANGIQGNEPNQFLNPNIVENHALPVNNAFTEDKNTGVLKTTQLLFGGTQSAANGGYFYVIPSDTNEQVDVTIVYDVETIDPKLAGLLSDSATHGISIENVISKAAILGAATGFEAGKQYLVKIHLGMTSVKIDAVVTDWVLTDEVDVNLPDNQDVWDGNAVAPYSADPNDADTFIIETPAQFAKFAADVTAGEAFVGKTVKLTSDIDLGNKDWTPIGYFKNRSGDAGVGFQGTFDGNGKTISNLKVSDISTDNGELTFAGLFGIVNPASGNTTTIKNLTIDGFTINSNHQAAAIVAHAGTNSPGIGAVVITNCTVKNGSVTTTPWEKSSGVFDDGNQAGALAGSFFNGTFTVKDNTVQNVTIQGYRDLGGLMGFSTAATVSGNALSGMAITQVDQAGYVPLADWKKATVRQFVGRKSSSTNDDSVWALGANNTFSGTVDTL